MKDPIFGSGQLDIWPCRRGSWHQENNYWLIEAWPAAAQDPIVSRPGNLQAEGLTSERREEGSF